MTGYTRADTADNIANGKAASADDLDAEFNAIQTAFNASTGHTHDGTSGSGAPVTKVGPTQDVVIGATTVLPKTDNTVDLGSSSFEFKDLWIDGTANIDALVADTADINSGTIDNTVIGAITAAAGSFTTVAASGGVTGNVTGNLTGNVTGNVTGALTSTSITVTGGTINGTSVGATTPSTGAFTTMTATSLVAALTSSSVTFTGGSINGVTIGATTPSTGAFTTISSSGTITGNLTGAVTGNASTATTLQTARTIAISGDVVGSASFNGSANISIAATIQPDSVVMGTDTTGAYVATVAGTANQITVAGSGLETAAVTLSLPAAVILPGTLTTTGDVIVGGNLTINGTTTTVNSNTVNIGDSVITLNSDEVGVASQDAGIEIERGTLANVSWLWDETNDRWTAGAQSIVAGSFIGPVTGNVTGNINGAVTSSAVTITGGTITGITDLAIADGGTGASTAAGALTNLGLTATAAQINTLATIPGTLTGTELGFMDGVTSSVQTQIDTKVAKAGDALTGGFTATTDNDGTFTTGTYTPTPVGGNFKNIVNNGAFSFAAPSVAGDYTLVVQITNGATAGAITFTGFTRTSGDAFNTTNTNKFFVFVTKCNGLTLAVVQALQ